MLPLHWLQIPKTRLQTNEFAKHSCAYCLGLGFSLVTNSFLQLCYKWVILHCKASIGIQLQKHKGQIRKTIIFRWLIMIIVCWHCYAVMLVSKYYYRTGSFEKQIVAVMAQSLTVSQPHCKKLHCKEHTTMHFKLSKL